MYEWAPMGRKPKMTKRQMQKYLRDLEQKRAIAQLKLDKAKASWELDNAKELDEIERLIDDL